jgi:hypothetical protein
MFTQKIKALKNDSEGALNWLALCQIPVPVQMNFLKRHLLINTDYN